jgi:hypothetical protein
MACYRIEAGSKPATPVQPGVITALSLRLAQTAQKLGLVVLRNQASRVRGSQSRYLYLQWRGKRWLVRVSNHHRPNRIKALSADPNIDFISFDGEAGFERAIELLSRLKFGDLIWHDADAIPDPEEARA